MDLVQCIKFERSLENVGNPLQSEAGCDRMIPVVGGWAQCPVCRKNKHLAKVRPGTRGREIVWYCRVCKQEIIVNINEGPSVQRQSQ